jgi:hypothetical protein
MAILKELREYSGNGQYLFPSKWKTNPTLVSTGMICMLRRMGYGKDQMSTHGFRAAAATMLNEQGYNRDWIERQLAHAERNSIRAAYNYAEYMPERRKMMQKWADYLTKLKKEAQPEAASADTRIIAGSRARGKAEPFRPLHGPCPWRLASGLSELRAADGDAPQGA